MVLKVDTEPSEETKPILGSNSMTDYKDKDLKIQDEYKYIILPTKPDPLRIENLDGTLKLFTKAVNLKDVPLAKQCIEILNNQLDKTNALLILHHIDDSKTTPPDPYDVAPSAPPIVENDNHIDEDWAQDLIDNVRNNCLLEIDKNADYILKRKEILRLPYSDLLAITTRDTLQVSSELVVYSVVVRWSMEECKRRVLDPHTTNLRAVLRELIHAPRYGLLSKTEFMCKTIEGVKGPGRSGILDEKHIKRITKYIKDRSKGNPVEELPHNESLPRKMSHENSSALHSGISGNSACSANSTCDKVVINFLTCWTAVFD